MEKLFQTLHQLQLILLPLGSLAAYIILRLQEKTPSISDGFTFFSGLVWIFVWVLGMVFSRSLSYPKKSSILFLMCVDSLFLLFLMYLLSPVGLDFFTCLILYFLIEVNSFGVSWIVPKFNNNESNFYFHHKEDTFLLTYLVGCTLLINFTALGLHAFEVLLQIGLLGQLVYGFALVLSVYLYSQTS